MKLNFSGGMIQTRLILFLGVSFNSIRMLIGATSILFLLNYKGFELRDITLLRGMQISIVAMIDVPLGYFADKFSRKFSVMLAIVCSVLWLCIVGFFDNYYLIVMGEILNSISLAFFGGAYQAILISWYKNEAKNTDLTTLFQTLNFRDTLGMFGAVVIAGFVPMENLQQLWLVSGSLMLLLFVYGIVFIRNDNFTASTDQIERLRFKKDWMILKNDSKAIWNTLRESSAWIIAVCFILLTVIFYMIINYNQPLLQDFFPEAKAVHYSLFLGLILLAQMFSTKFISKKRVFDCFAFLLLFVIVILAIGVYLKSFLSPVILIFLYFFLNVMRESFSLQFHTLIPDSLRATSDSIISTIYRMASGLSFFIVSILIIDDQRALVIPFIYIVVIYCIFIIMISGLMIRRKRVFNG